MSLWYKYSTVFNSFYLSFKKKASYCNDEISSDLCLYVNKKSLTKRDSTDMGIQFYHYGINVLLWNESLFADLFSSINAKIFFLFLVVFISELNDCYFAGIRGEFKLKLERHFLWWRRLWNAWEIKDGNWCSTLDFVDLNVSDDIKAISFVWNWYFWVEFLCVGLMIDGYWLMLGFLGRGE